MTLKNDWTNGDTYTTAAANALATQVNENTEDIAGTEITHWANVKDPAYGAYGDDSNDDTAAIQDAIDTANSVGGGTVYFPSGIYKITSALVWRDRVTAVAEKSSFGYGALLKQYTAGEHGIIIEVTEAFARGYFEISGLGISAVAVTGTAHGIYLKQNSGTSTHNPFMGCRFRDLFITGFRGYGFNAEGLITSVLDRVTCQENGGGFFLNGDAYGTTFSAVNTSLTLNSCYANGNTGIGFNVVQSSYIVFNACASDSNGNQYVIDKCNSIVFNACGCEYGASEAPTTGDGFTIKAISEGITLNSCLVVNNQHYGLYVTGNSSRVTVTGHRGTSSGAHAVASLKVDSGSHMTEIGSSYGATTRDVASGTVTIVDDGVGGSSFHVVGGTDIPITDGGTGVSTLPTGLLKGAGTSAITAATAGTDYYAPTGTDVALADGGTGTSLTAPVTDKFVFYDVSSGAMAFLTPGTGMTITGTTVDVTASGSGDVAGPSSAVDSEVVLFSGTSGKIIKRASATGMAKLTSGVLGTGSAGTDYYAPSSTDVAIADGGTGVSTLPSGLLKGAGTSAITAATQGTDYYAPAGTDVAITDGGTGVSTLPSGLLKGAGTSAITAAVAGTDYAAATSGSGILKGNGAGGTSTATAGSDYYAPGSTDVAIADGGTGVSTLPTGLLKGAGTSAITAATAGTDYVTPTGTENLTNKTFTAYNDYTSQGTTAPATPSASTVRIFARTGVSTLDSLAYINTLGVPIVLGRDVNFFAKNTSGSTIAKGSVVCINSASGSIPLVIKAQADAGMTKLPAVGVVVADIANNAIGMVMITGTINNVNTSGVGAGNTLYVSPTTAGVLTDTRPTHPNIVQPIGECLNSNATTGAILVNCTEINPGLVDGTNQASFGVGDGTGAGAKSVLFKNSNTGTLQWTPTTSRIITLPDGTGTVYISGGTDVPITDGGTGVSTLPTGLLKGAGTSAITAATAGTDYYAPAGTDIPITDGGTGVSTLPTGLLVGAGTGAITAKTAPSGAVVGDTDTQTLTAKTLTSPKIGTSILDTNGNVLLGISVTSAANNYVSVANGATGVAFPGIVAGGSDSNISFDLLPKGTGLVRIYVPTGQTPTLAAAGADTNHNLNLIGKGTGVIQINSVNAVDVSTAQTLTTKRITKRSTQVSNTTSWTINTDLYDFAEDTGLTGTVTIAFSGTPTVGQTCWVTVTGTATRTIAYDSTSEDSGNTTRPTTTSGTAPLDIAFRWNSATSKWRCVGYS